MRPTAPLGGVVEIPACRGEIATGCLNRPNSGQPARADLSERMPILDHMTWTRYGHFLGGDAIDIEATPEVADEFLRDCLGIDLADECPCDFGCGPIWSLAEGSNPDGSHPARPEPLEASWAERLDGTPRTRVYTADQIAIWLAATLDREQDRHSTDPEDGTGRSAVDASARTPVITATGPRLAGQSTWPGLLGGHIGDTAGDRGEAPSAESSNTLVAARSEGEAMAWPPDGLEVDYTQDDVAVCPEHLRFIPCRGCPPGEERYSTDPEDVRRTREYQSGGAVCSCVRDDFDRTYFDRTVCPEPCSGMHQRCRDCGRAVDGCPFEEPASSD